jgi:hypothetical protein
MGLDARRENLIRILNRAKGKNFVRDMEDTPMDTTIEC